MKITAEAELLCFLETAKKTGCPQDQIKNFLRFGYVPQPKQLHFHAACRSADFDGGPDEIGFGGSRGPGKSHSCFSQIALDDCFRFKDLKCLYIRKVGKQAKEQFEDLRLKVLPNVPHHYNRQEGVVTISETGSRILIGNIKDEKDIDNYLSLEYDVIGIEETTTLTLSKYKALRDSNRTSKAGIRPRIYNTTNPGNLGHSWYKQRFVKPFRDGTEKFTKFIPATLEDNKYIDKDYQRKIEENTGWKLKAHRYGDWDIAAGQYYDCWREEVHVLPRWPEVTVIEHWWDRFGGYDHGYVHPFVFGCYAITGDGDIIKFAEAGDNHKQPEEIYKLICQAYPQANGLTIYAGHDCWSKQKDGGPELVEQFHKLGLRFVKANIDRKQGGQHLRWLLDHKFDDNNVLIKKPKFYVTANCWRTIQQFPNMITDVNDPEDMLKQDADDDDIWSGDDAIDETRYATMSRWDKSRAAKQKPNWGTGGWFLEQAKRGGDDMGFEE